MAKLALIDGSGFVFRAFHALPPLSTSKGLQTNAVYGFTRMVLSLIETLNVDHIAVTFDAARKTFRNEIYNEYKANRPPAPDELVHQFSLIREAVTALNIVSLEQEGFEADDIIATYADLAEKHGFEVLIISSDKDLMQLIKSPNIYMYDPVKKKYIREAEVITKFGIPPEKLIYAQSLIGDSSDNVPGVKGLGPKTAAKLIEKYNTLAGIYNNIDDITKKGIKEKLIANKNNAFISLELVTLKKDMPVSIPLDNLQLKAINPYSLYNFCKKLEFISLATNIAKKYNLTQSDLQDNEPIINSEEKPSIEHLKNSDNDTTNFNTNYSYQIINDIATAEELTLNLNKSTNIYFYFENNTLGITTDDSNIVYLIIINKQKELISLFSNELQPFSNISLENLVTLINPLLLNDGINKVVFNLKSFIKDLDLENIVNANGFDDIHIMSYILDGPSATPSLDHLSRSALLCDLSAVEHKLAASLPDESLALLLQKVLCLKQVYEIFKRRIIFEQGKYVYEELDKPLSVVLSKVEHKGVLINPEILLEISSEIEKEIKLLEQEIFKISEGPFNLNSPKQIGELLFEKLNIKGKKNKSGSWKTDAYFLEDLDNKGVAIAGLILSWRKFSKLKSTYVDSLPSYISKKDCRIHTTFLQTSTNTGRLSSLDPNLQNIPIKSTIGSRVREAFVAPAGYKIISLDYSQIELRLLAHIGNVDSLINSFNNNEDIHEATAKEIFNLNDNEISDEYRRKAKTINFGIIYGISEFGLARRLQLDIKEAKKYIESYFKRYPEILNYMEAAKEEARKNGYVLTEFGRKCYISGINSSNYALKSFAERAAINAKLQGTAADIMRLCMIKCFNSLYNSNLDASIILQIHDELIIECKEEMVTDVCAKIVNIMENIYSLKIPLKVNYVVGNNWLDSD